jgi:hypothetical protein
VNHLSFLKNNIKGDQCTLINAWGVMIIDRRMLHQSWTAALLQVAYA